MSDFNKKLIKLSSPQKNPCKQGFIYRNGT